MSRTTVVVNKQAPVVGSSEIAIAVAPEVAWDVLTAIERWPTRNPAIKAVSLQGDVVQGSKFRWKSGPGTITSTIRDVNEARRIAWTGTSFGIKATHVYTLEPCDGGTFVRTEESYEGLLAGLFRARLQSMLDDSLHSGLLHLKAEAERTAQW